MEEGEEERRRRDRERQKGKEEWVEEEREVGEGGV